MLFFVMLFLWFILNGSVSMQLLVAGMLVCGGIYGFTKKYIDIQWSKKSILTRVFELVQYILILLIEIVKSNVAVIKLVLTPNMESWHPCFMCFRSNLKSEMLRVVLANSITLIPGTVTVELEGEVLMVHVLDHRRKDSVENSANAQAMKKIEGDEKI